VQAKFSVFSRGLAFLAVSGFKLLLVLKAAPLAAFAWASMAEVALAAIGLALAYKLRGHRLLLWKWDAAAARGLLKDSWPLILSGLTIMIFMKIDQIMLGRMKGFIDLGVYASAQKIIETWNFIPMIILSSLYPSMVKFRMAGEAGFSGFAQKIFVLLFVMNLAAILFLALFSRGLMTMLFGGRFAGAALPLLILSLGSVFNFSSALRGQIFLINNLTIYHTYSGLVGIAVLVCLNLVLIPRLGTTGVAVSNAVSAFVSGYLTSFVFRPLRFIGRMQSRAFFFRMEKNAPPV
jgi:PST family polysaccharide transporter